ncbi:MAG TPA: exo-beta-N-acetylmuramidase NamZ domain-containing protein, partial [Longimicrobiales bacterium]
MRLRHLFRESALAAALMLSFAGCGTNQNGASANGTPAGANARVVPGLEVLLRDSLHLVRGKRVGFLTNQTAVTSTGESGIDLLHKSVNLVALFGPEHGLRGGVEGGEKIAGGVDAKTGVTVHSLYGATQKP